MHNHIHLPVNDENSINSAQEEWCDVKKQNKVYIARHMQRQVRVKNILPPRLGKNFTALLSARKDN
jgi:hypothetical protein